MLTPPEEAESPSEQPVYWWFQGATIAALRDRLNAVLDDPEAVLIVKREGRGITLQVLDSRVAESVQLAPLNESHPCPPFCR